MTGARLTWLVVTVALGAGLIFDRIHTLPDRASGGLAAAFAAAIVAGLWTRLGSPTWASVTCAVIYGAAAVGSQNALLLRGAAIATAVLVAVFAIVATVPAQRFRATIPEVLLAWAIALLGAFAVAGFHVNVDADVFGYTALALALFGAFAAVYQPGAGLHGLGRRGYVLIVSISLLLIFIVGYSVALTHWGSRYVSDTIDDVDSWTSDTFGATPHLIQLAVGVPSLVWGVFTRARRRQGWWMCAFGVALTAPATTAFVDGTPTGTAILGCAYGVLVGVVIGFVIVRVEQALTGSRGRRARRTEEAAAHRPEPKRWEPLR